jgi:hypothetical protein
MSEQHMLSTKDNPYNPWTEWDQWFAWDTQEDYHSLSLLGRVVRTSDELSQQLQDQAVEDAIDEIVTENVSGVHIKVAKPSDVQS